MKPRSDRKRSEKDCKKSVDAIANAFSEMEKENGWSRNNPGDLATAKKELRDWLQKNL